VSTLCRLNYVLDLRYGHAVTGHCIIHPQERMGW
jgi:hypothetical protein